jgi:hypothetical protein
MFLKFVTELKELLLHNLESVTVVHNPRHCTKTSHALAVLGIECEVGTNPILDVNPICIQNIVVENTSN